ncbi:MAG: hypothetical protein M1121_01145 [Actinobacteria bacterium]|nr:hypothetical protein [Actinomycetota bacterium]
MTKPSAAPLAYLGPTPPDEETLAVIAAAVEMTWSRSTSTVVDDRSDETGRAWRFSGRWWNRPVQTRRARPDIRY